MYTVFKTKSYKVDTVVKYTETKGLKIEKKIVNLLKCHQL